MIFFIFNRTLHNISIYNCAVMGSSCSSASSAKVEDINNAANDDGGHVPDPPRPPPIPEPPVDQVMHNISNGKVKSQDEEEIVENALEPNAEIISQHEADVVPTVNPLQPGSSDELITEPTPAETGDDGQLKIIYFSGLRLRAEPARLILRYAEVPYEDELITFEDWSSYKNSTPMGLLPVLKTARGDLCQSQAIARYLAKKYGLAGKNNWDAACIDMLMQEMIDAIDEMKPLLLERDEGKRGDLWRQTKEDVLTPLLEKYTKYFEQTQTGWFVGDELSWADLAISDFLSTLSNKWDNTLLDDFSALRNHTEAVLALPAIQNYLNERPDAQIKQMT